MSVNKTSKLNWNYILVGALLLILNLFPNNSKINNDELTEKTISLSHDIKKFRRQSHNSSYALLYSNETAAAFKIDVAGEIASQWTILDSLKKGDTLTVKFLSNNESDLNEKNKEVVIYSLQKQNQLFFDVAGYNRADKTYGDRLLWITSILSALLLLRGFNIINSKTGIILGLISFIVIITLRILNKF